MGATPEIASIDELVNRRLEELLPQKIEEALRQREESRTPSMAIIATKGTLDWAYPPFILGSTAAALGWDVSIFFTFYGLNLLKKDLGDPKVSPPGNPGMPMKMPFGPDWFSRSFQERGLRNTPVIEWPIAKEGKMLQSKQRAGWAVIRP